jgi:hypothetical protein
MNRALAATPSGPPPLLPALLAATAIGLLVTSRSASEPRSMRLPQRPASPVPSPLSMPEPPDTRPATPPTTAGRQLNRAAALLAFAVLADSAVEHYRGSFQNRAMYAPLVTASVTLAASLFGSADERARRHPLRDGIYAVAAATGLAGLGFHAYNILKRPGGVSWVNLFYAAPIGAPVALTLAGVLGRGAEQVRDAPSGRAATILGMPAGRLLAGVTACGLAGTVAEAALLHFRGAYHNPAMLLPVSIPPITAALLGATAIQPTRWLARVTRQSLRLTAFLGFAGVGFHAFGVSRNMGGWHNWSQNVLNGPPLPAPPSFTGLAFAGFAALALAEETGDG